MSVTGIPLSLMRDFVEQFGGRRAEQGDVFQFEPVIRGFSAYSYRYDGTQVGVGVWGDDPKGKISVFGCARAGMAPTLELYRYVSRWRTSTILASPYVIEKDNYAAVMCERIILADMLAPETAAINIAITVDLLQETVARLATDLSGADGYRVEEFESDLTMCTRNLVRLWEINDPRVASIMGLGG